MSRSSLRQVEVPTGVELTLTAAEVKVKGKHGNLDFPLPRNSVNIEYADNMVSITHDANLRADRAMAGTVQALVRNMIKGVSDLWEKKLELRGTGYRAATSGNKITLQLGYSHPVEYELPAGIEVELISPTEIVVKGADKQLVGQTAAEIRSKRPPEPYKGKGVRYADEYVRRKEGKKG